MKNTKIRVIPVNCPHCNAQQFAWVIALTGARSTCIECHEAFVVKIEGEA